VEEAAFFAPRPAGDPSFGEWFSDPDVAQMATASSHATPERLWWAPAAGST
jgi:hypothetical protein